MVFAAFPGPQGAGQAFARLKDEGFETAGFSVIGPQSERNEPAGDYSESPELNQLMSNMNLAPTLTIEGRDVASAGALPNLLNPSPGATFHGLSTALQNAGASEKTAQAFADTIRDAGLILGLATEGPGRAEQARSICQEAGALETTALEVPNKEERP